MLMHKPMKQAFAILLQFRTYDRSTDCQIFVIDYLTECFATTINIVSIPDISF